MFVFFLVVGNVPLCWWGDFRSREWVTTLRFRKSSHAILGTKSKVQLKGTGWIYPQPSGKERFIYTYNGFPILTMSWWLESWHGVGRSKTNRFWAAEHSSQPSNRSASWSFLVLRPGSPRHPSAPCNEEKSRRSDQRRASDPWGKEKSSHDSCLLVVFDPKM